MNILFCASDNNRLSGAFLSMVKLASILQTHYGHKILVILPNEGEGTKLLKYNSIQYVIVKSFHWTLSKENEGGLKDNLICKIKKNYNKFAVKKIKRLIEENKIDLVHINTSWTYVGALAGYDTGIPVIWHIREFLEEDQGRVFWNPKYSYNLINRADRVVAISKSIFRKYSKIVDPKKIRCIYNGIDPEPFYDPNHKPFMNNCYLFIIVGNLGRQKRQLDAVNACINVKKLGYNNIKLSIVGNEKTDYAEKVKELIRRENADDYIKFEGRTDNPAYFYKKADITFMCSEAEAYGRVTVEAMLGGSLVIGANSAATKEVIENGITGLTFEVGNIQDLTRQIVFAINNAEQARTISAQGQKRALNTMTADVNAENVDTLYKEVIAERRACI